LEKIGSVAREEGDLRHGGRSRRRSRRGKRRKRKGRGRHGKKRKRREEEKKEREKGKRSAGKEDNVFTSDAIKGSTRTRLPVWKACFLASFRSGFKWAAFVAHRSPKDGISAASERCNPTASLGVGGSDVTHQRARLRGFQVVAVPGRRRKEGRHNRKSKGKAPHRCDTKKRRKGKAPEKPKSACHRKR
jgi:hypothetical protein